MLLNKTVSHLCLKKAISLPYLSLNKSVGSKQVQIKMTSLWPPARGLESRDVSSVAWLILNVMFWREEGPTCSKLGRTNGWSQMWGLISDCDTDFLLKPIPACSGALSLSFSAEHDIGLLLVLPSQLPKCSCPQTLVPTCSFRIWASKQAPEKWAKKLGCSWSVLWYQPVGAYQRIETCTETHLKRRWEPVCVHPANHRVIAAELK